jgi:hypothetical protein
MATVGTLFVLLGDINQAHGRVFIESQHGIVDQGNGGAAAGAHPDRTTLAEDGFEAGFGPGLGFLDQGFDLAMYIDKSTNGFFTVCASLAGKGQAGKYCNQQGKKVPANSAQGRTITSRKPGFISIQLLKAPFFLIDQLGFETVNFLIDHYY